MKNKVQEIIRRAAQAIYQVDPSLQPYEGPTGRDDGRLRGPGASRAQFLSGVDRGDHREAGRGMKLAALVALLLFAGC